MNLLDRFTNSTQFKDYNDFYNNFRLNVPENFNYAYDVVDEYARLTPEKRALVWCDDLGDERIFSFADVKRLSDKAANFFRSRGIGKRLLDEVKKTHPKLTLHVYRKNKGAAAFYEREGFQIAGEGVDEATGEVEYTMSYTRK